jgi:hypothetical protein
VIASTAPRPEPSPACADPQGTGRAQHPFGESWQGSSLPASQIGLRRVRRWIANRTAPPTRRTGREFRSMIWKRQCGGSTASCRSSSNSGGWSGCAGRSSRRRSCRRRVLLVVRSATDPWCDRHFWSSPFAGLLGAPGRGNHGWGAQWCFVCESDYLGWTVFCFGGMFFAGSCRPGVQVGVSGGGAVVAVAAGRRPVWMTERRDVEPGEC